MTKANLDAFLEAIKNLRNQFGVEDHALVVGSFNLSDVKGKTPGTTDTKILAAIGGDLDDLAHTIIDAMNEDTQVRETIIHAYECYHKQRAFGKKDIGALLSKFLESMVNPKNRPSEADMLQDKAIMENPENAPQPGEKKSEWMKRVLPKFSDKGRKQAEAMYEALG